MADPKKPANKIVKTNNRFKLSRNQKSIKESIQDVKRKFNRLNNKLKTLDRSRYLSNTLAAGANEFPNTPVVVNMSDPKWLRNLFKTDNIVKATRLGVGTLKTAKHLGVGLALNYLSDRYLVPHAERLGTKLGEALIPIGRDIDKRLERRKK